MAGDNQQFFIIAEDHLPEILDLAFKTTGWSPKATHYAIRPLEVDGWDVKGERDSLIICRWNDNDTVPFPGELSSAEVSTIVQAWLSQADYGPEPDHDGDNGKGFIAWRDYWGHVERNQGAIIAITPAWIMYGK